MEIKAVIDRFEGNKAVLLVGNDEVQVLWPRLILPALVQEGDILHLDLAIDREATAKAKADADSLLQEILENNN